MRVLKRVTDGVEVSSMSMQCMPTGDKPQFNADDWDGVNGDLVAHFLRGGNVRLQDLHDMINLDQMTPAELISVGTGDLSEREFFDMLCHQNVSTLYDLRGSESQRDMRTNGRCLQHFFVKNLRISCKARGILYKHMAIGRESAYGVLAHLQSAEGQHTLIELVWQGQRARTAFLGVELDWRNDARRAIAEKLVTAGHTVGHLHLNGALESHEAGQALPDFLLREEDRLKKIEKMRLAGELQRVSKSSVDRSTESVAMKLMQGPTEIDAVSILRDATNQQELKFAQRHLAAMQRYSEKYELPSKVLSGAPKFIGEEARSQAAWVEDRKKEKNNVEMPVHDRANDCDVADEDLQVECRVCSCFYSWQDLIERDGCCSLCYVSAESSGANSSVANDICKDGCDAGWSKDSVLDCLSLAPDLLVECIGCSESMPWTLLSQGDGKCTKCFDASVVASEGMEGVCQRSSPLLCDDALVAHPEAASSARWQRRNRSDQ